MLFSTPPNDKRVTSPIKCQGIKTNLVEWIKSKIKDHNIWYEPFCGSCVVGFNIKPPKAVFGDNNPHLINVYQGIKDKKITDVVIREFLEYEGKKLLESNGEHYYDVRNRFNQKKNPLDFLFLNRSCFNGLIRFNPKGEFNTPFCKRPNRFAKSYITKICNQVKDIANIITNNDYSFVCQDFTDTIRLTNDNDLVYCDPPYIARHANYFTSWDIEKEKILYKTLKSSNTKFILSTWYSNKFRKNDLVHGIWNEFKIETREHFYFLGGKEDNRHSIHEALIFNV